MPTADSRGRRAFLVGAITALLVAQVAAAFAVALEEGPGGPPVDPGTAVIQGVSRLTPGGPTQDAWRVTSGSLFVRDGVGWTGPPDGEPVDSWDDPDTGSAVFRAVLDRPLTSSAEVSFTYTARRFVETDRTPPQAWDGLHLLLRWQDPETFYSFSVLRRDGMVVVKKKVPGGPSNGGTYLTLGEARIEQAGAGERHVAVSIADHPAGSVSFAITIDGVRVMEATDDGSDAPVIAQPGRAGLRGDNLEFVFQDFVVRPLAAASDVVGA